MQTKSKIQLIKEIQDGKDIFQTMINKIMEKYQIEDNIFYFDGRTIQDANSGYFAVVESYDSLKEAVDNMNINTMGVRVINNEKFELGELHKVLSECKSEKIYDIDTLDYVQ